MIEDIIRSITPLDDNLIKKAYERIDNLTKPKGSLGRLEEIAGKLYAINDGRMPVSFKKAVVVFASDHGITAQNVSPYPNYVTYQMVYNFLSGGAGINVFARHSRSDVFVVDVGVDYNFGETNRLIVKKVAKGTKDFSKEPAMTIEEAKKSIVAGMEMGEEVYKRGYNLVGTGEMGIGNTTPSTAIMSVITGVSLDLLTGRGAGLDDDGLKRKKEVIEKAIILHKPVKNDPLDILSKVGGFEIGAIAGLILYCSSKKIPVVVDGFISSAGFLISYLFSKDVKDYVFFAHRSNEQGHRVFFDFIGEKPVLDLDMRLGEGTGSALAFFIIEASAKMFLEMATFESANISREMK
ncbi:MAG: nicotinate-nucleotide--dimethylbenzimidazole phosphoribosyltransferase [Proteobacteria bacterium]|nr:nicotinate-nucleotide--dimethylbenzimidazole phosphoribosyltransferase [Pseudomonadota bacterium]